jgi:3-hydroxybutyryl-CoA dehydrogenase
MTTKITIGVVGAGTMGRGIIQLYAQAGHPVCCVDAQPGAATRAIDDVLGMLRRQVDKGRLTSAAMADIKATMRAADGLEGLADCGIVIEAIAEDLSAKRQLICALEDIVGADTILATNTSSLTVSEIAAACRRPDRVAGLHFFNPVPLMKVAEVVATMRTAPAVVRTLRSITEGAGHRAVVTADQPGFLVNHAGRGLYTEGLRIVEEQIATAADVDDVLREGMGFRMGPFELLDLTGLDVSSRVMASIYEQFQQEPRFRPSSLVAPRVAAGLLGRKTGEGWYRYEDGTQIRPAAAIAPAAMPGLKVWIAPDAARATELQILCRQAGAIGVGQAAEADLVIVQPWGEDATAVSLRLGVDPAHSVAIDPLVPLDRRRTLMLTTVTSPAARDAAHALLAADGGVVTVINDSAGFIAQRVMATIVNIAANIVQRGIASIDDLEDSVRLGLGYPHGPLSWGDRIGAARIVAILRGQTAATGDPRYRPSQWLVRRAALGLPLTTPETARC